MSFRGEILAECAANKACAAGNKNLHRRIASRRVKFCYVMRIKEGL
jgi:hypothetical protein